jgi:hypothetical protein
LYPDDWWDVLDNIYSRLMLVGKKKNEAHTLAYIIRSSLTVLNLIKVRVKWSEHPR